MITAVKRSKGSRDRSRVKKTSKIITGSFPNTKVFMSCAKQVVGHTDHKYTSKWIDLGITGSVEIVQNGIGDNSYAVIQVIALDANQTRRGILLE